MVAYRVLPDTVVAMKTAPTPTTLTEIPGYITVEGPLPASDDYIRAIGYARHSKGEDDSVESQVHGIPRWAEQAATAFNKPVRVIGIVTDYTSAWTNPDDIPPKRAGWDAINDLLASGEYDLVLAREQSRLSRDEDEPTIFYRRARRYGVEVYTAFERHVSSTDMGMRIMTKIKAVTNNEESSVISKRIKENNIPAREVGFWLGGVIPTGWWPQGGKYVDEVDVRGKTKRILIADRVMRTHPQTGRAVYGKVLHPDPELTPAIHAAIKALYAGGTWTDAANAMKEAGWPTAANGKVYLGTVRGTLTSPLLVGYLPHDEARDQAAKKRRTGREKLEYVQRDANGIPVQGVEPILTLTEFLALQDVIERMTRRRAHQEVALAAGVVVCGKCGKGMHRTKVGRRGAGARKVYTCSKTNGGCNGVSIMTTYADTEIESALLARFTPEAIQTQAEAYEREAAAILQTTPEAHREEVQHLQELLDDLTELIEITTSAAGRKALTKKFNDTAERIDALTLTAPGLPTLGNVAGIVDHYNLADLWPTLTPDQRNAILREAVEHIAILPTVRTQNEKGQLTNTAGRVRIWWRGEIAPANWPLDKVR